MAIILTMALAVFISGIMLVAGVFVLWRSRARASFICLKNETKTKECIVKLPRVKGRMRQGFIIFEKIDNEIKLFNSIGVVMQCRRRVPVMYLDCFSKLVDNCRWIQKDGDGYTKLMYLYACVNLFRLTNCELVRKQLLKNCIYVFGRIVVKRKLKAQLLNKLFYAIRPKRFKLLGAKLIDKPDFEIVGEFLKRRDSISYVTYFNNEVIVKQYADKNLASPEPCGIMQNYSKFGSRTADKRVSVQCFEVEASQRRTFAFEVGEDKMRYSLSHTSDTFFCIGGKRSVGVFVSGKAEFGSSICEKGEQLKVYVGFEGLIKICVIESDSKAEIVRIIQKLKHCEVKIDYLCDKREAAMVSEIEETFEKAYLARYIEGESLKEKFAVATKYVPTLFLPTLVFEITEQDEFFKVVDSFWVFKKIAAAGRNLNVVFLYSDLNDTVREIINAFVDKGEAKQLIKAGVFLFFINRVTANNKAVSFLSSISKAHGQSHNYNVKVTNNKNIEVNRHISSSFPVTHNVFARNIVKKTQSAKVCIAVEVGGDYSACVLKKGTGVCVTGLKPGSRSFNLKLPLGAKVRSDLGKVIANGEVTCDRVFVECDVKLLPNEEKILKIIKNEGEFGRREKKDAFIGSLEALSVRSGDKRLEQMFSAKITDDKNEKLLSAIKTAVRGMDKEMFFGFFNKREKMPSDVWAYLAEKIIGLRLLKGRVQLMPCVQITGDFELSFNYAGTPYNFTVKQKGGGFNVRYGENEYRNFLQVAMK